MSSPYQQAGPTYVKVSNLIRKKKFFPRQIGFRGRHDHGKAPDDPVYPTKSVPFQLKPRHPSDWRGGGRAVLCAGMAVLEDSGQKLRSPGMIFDWQEKGYCNERCGSQCSKSKDRIYCKWKVPGTKFELLNKLDGILSSYKGVVSTSKPIFTVHRKVALRNQYNSLAYLVAPGGSSSGGLNSNTLVPEISDEIPHPAFGLNPEIVVKRTPEEELYDPETDVEREGEDYVVDEDDEEETKIEQCLLDHNC